MRWAVRFSATLAIPFAIIVASVCVVGGCEKEVVQTQPPVPKVTVANPQQRSIVD